MSLAELRVENLRCIESAALEFAPELNVIAGENGAGKTSILEAIFLLGRGRSFRTRTNERLIRHGQAALTVFGRTRDRPAKAAGVEVSREGTRARINGQSVHTLLELSSVLPVQAIDPEIHKLIDGRFPEYGRVIPANPSKQVEADREGLRQALQRTAILSNEKYRGVRVNLKSDLITIQAHNPEQEEAEDQVEVTYKGDEVEIGFNVTYLLDALAAVDSDKVILGLTDGNSSCLVRAAGAASSKYVVMPMRL
jgi:hypothetical protein